MENKVTFNAKLVLAASADRVYRVTQMGNDLYFIRIGGQGGVQEGITRQFGLLGFIIGALLKKRSDKKKESLIQNIDQTHPEQLLAEHKHNFKLNREEIQGGAIEPPSFFAAHGPQVGRWNFHLMDGKKMNFQFDQIADMKTALDVLPILCSGGLSVNVEWNEGKQRFEKKNGS